MHARTRQADTCPVSDLGDFLRARRAALDPSRAGLADDGRLRRVPGLRREELSRMANVSVDYIVRLEQGRTRRVSRAVLDALADALQLTSDERTYLATLAEGATHGGRARPEVTPQLQQLLDEMRGIPAMVVYRRMEVLAWNRGAAALLLDFGALPASERNLVRHMFLNPTFRSLYADWPGVARDTVAILRMEAGLHPDDPDLLALVDELTISDNDFRAWWPSHPVHGLGAVSRTFNHPLAGTLTLDVHQLSIDADLLLVAYTAAAGSQEALRDLVARSPRG